MPQNDYRKMRVLPVDEKNAKSNKEIEVTGVAQDSKLDFEVVMQGENSEDFLLFVNKKVEESLKVERAKLKSEMEKLLSDKEAFQETLQKRKMAELECQIDAVKNVEKKLITFLSEEASIAEELAIALCLACIYKLTSQSDVYKKMVVDNIKTVKSQFGENQRISIHLSKRDYQIIEPLVDSLDIDVLVDEKLRDGETTLHHGSKTTKVGIIDQLANMQNNLLRVLNDQAIV